MNTNTLNSSGAQNVKTDDSMTTCNDLNILILMYFLLCVQLFNISPFHQMQCKL